MPEITPSRHGRTQWDAMAEATSDGRSALHGWRINIRALLAAHGYRSWSLFLVYKLIEWLSHGH
jgi:hypothetical protein